MKKRSPTNWAEIIPKEWISDKYPLVRFVLYSSSNKRDSIYVTSRMIAKAASLISDYPVEVFHCETTDEFSYQSMSLSVIYSHDTPALVANPISHTVPPGNYILFISPILAVEGGGTRELETDNAILAARGLLCATLGGSIAHQRLAQFEVSAENPEKISASSNTIVNYQSSTNFIYFDSVSFQKLITALNMGTVLDENTSLSLSFIGRAYENTDSSLKLFDLWSALETIMVGYKSVKKFINNGHPGSIWQKEMRYIQSARNAMLHNGKRAELSEAQERILVATLVDLILTRAGIEDVSLREFMTKS